MDAARRRLLVVRHAKSAWPPGVPDRHRPLGPRGEADAPLMAEAIGDLVGHVDVAVVSPAQRTQQTWALMVEHLGDVPDVRTDERVYRDWGSALMAVVRDLPEPTTTALVLGHEPGVSELVLHLADRGNPLVRDRVEIKFPTCAVALLSIDGDWSDVVPGCARLERFLTPRDVRDRPPHPPARPPLG